MENLNLVVAGNLVKYRNKFGFTQQQLAEKISYSDKSVSKWERGESLPDVAVLLKLSKIYGISVDDFLTENNNKKHTTKKLNIKSHSLISFLSIGLVWFVASICFAILFMLPETREKSWLCFIYAIFVSAIVATVFSCLWGNRILQVISCSLILWGAILCTCLTAYIKALWIICVVGGFFQILIVAWFVLQKVLSQKRNIKEKQVL